MARPKKQDQQVPIPQQTFNPQQVMMPQPHQQRDYQSFAPQQTFNPQHHQQFQQQQMQHLQPQMPQMPQQPPPPPQQQQQQVVPQPMPAARTIDADSFASVRDSAVTRLATIVGLIREFAHDYTRQTNILMGVGDQQGEDPHSRALLAQLDNASAQLLLPGLGDLGAGVEEKKERKKRTHDPNAPKRPLTPYFLYMQHARSVIAGDLGAEAPKGAVQEEGQRRWAQMGSQEKQGWNTAYQYNLRLYNARVHSYKQAGNPLAKDMTDPEALEYADMNNIPMPELKDAAAAAAASNEQAAIAEQLAQAAGDDSSKTPRKPAVNRKRKSDAPDMTPQMASSATPASPDKKRRRSTKAPEGAEEPKKGRGKKTK